MVKQVWIILSYALLLSAWQNIFYSSYKSNWKLSRLQKREFTVISATTATPSLNVLPASIALVKKGKKKTVDAIYKDLQEQGDEHPINKYLQKKEYPTGVDAPIDFYKSCKSLHRTLSIVAEYNKKADTGFIVGLPPPQIMGGVLRDAGAKAVIVSMDSRSGGVSTEEFIQFVHEQSSAKLFLPGPVSVVWNDLIIDNIQVTYAAALGAAAIVLQPELLSDFQDTINHCKSMHIEPIVLIKNLQEGQDAINAGVRCLCMHKLDEQELVNLRKQLPTTSERPDLMYIARLRPEEDFSCYYEIDIAWTLRDESFSAVWPSPEALYATGMSDIYSVIHALRAKAAKKYLSPRQFMMDRKKEGATEFLGEILY
jgi:indole-3-glycerol phosphate synthase